MLVGRRWVEGEEEEEGEGEGGGEMIVCEIEYDTFWGFSFVWCLVWFGSVGIHGRFGH